jgi:hypothetical protein
MKCSSLTTAKRDSPPACERDPCSAPAMATFYFIKNDKFDDALLIAELLLNDRENLIHKAVGWMLREVGKRV